MSIPWMGTDLPPQDPTRGGTGRGKQQVLCCFAGAFAPTAGGGSANEKSKGKNGFGAKKRGHLSLTQRMGKAIPHFSNAVINFEAGGDTPLRQEQSRLQFTRDLQ